MDHNHREMEAMESVNKPEWEKPEVTEFDINLTTMEGQGVGSWDGAAYS